MLDQDPRLAQAVTRFPPGVQRLLLEALLALPEERAAVMGRLYQHPETRQIAELLIDLEEDRLMGLEVAEALKDSLQR